MDGVGGVTALAAEALGRGKEAHFFVVADSGGVEICVAGELADFHVCLLLFAMRKALADQLDA
jgi:hypothetical protein